MNSPSLQPPLAWLYAPTPEGFFSALRTTFAACIALGIAFWLELDNPAWAPSTVWAVAQLTRGESLSKAQWRIVGTIVGTIGAMVLTALSPQAPWIRFGLVAMWIGICCTMATFFRNFRSYAWVLAGYTCSVVCLDAAPDANSIFELAMARSTYITLGVVCETAVSCIFSANLARKAEKQMQDTLWNILLNVVGTVGDILRKVPSALSIARQEIAVILDTDTRIEFLEVEMGAHSHAADHARAALASISILLSRAFGTATRLQLLEKDHPALEEIIREILDFLSYLPTALSHEINFPLLLKRLQQLRNDCGKYLQPDFHETSESPAYNAELDEKILLVSLIELLGDLERAICEYYASGHKNRKDLFRFQRPPYRDGRLALNNGIRAALAILIAAFIFEVTAWSEGFRFVGLTGLVVGLFATNENPVLGSLTFLKGAIAAWIVAFFLVIVFMPSVTIFEPLAVMLSGAMMLGGLAKASPPVLAAGSAYSLLLPLMYGPQNHHVMQEIEFFNDNLAIVCSGIISVLVFRSIFPYNARMECQHLRRGMLRELQGLSDPAHMPDIDSWVAHSTERFSILLRHAGPSETPLVRAYLQGILAVLTLGLNIIRLRMVMDREYLPESARRPVRLLLALMHQATKSSSRLIIAADSAIRRLREIDVEEKDPLARLEVTRALTYLVVISHTLKTEGAFLDSEASFLAKWTPTGPQIASSFA